ncbi:MAG: PEP-CTERM sorting domain-containing protein [Bryobacterales bacterium]|nr:PEP-CTERM sorting domain-containing protein [Bryobacterales bacterium]
MNEVPEPASFAMVGLGVLALGLLGRRGRSQKA